MPPIAILLTLLGLVPFIVCGLAAMGGNPETADRMLMALIDYAALALAFSGGMYWALSLMPSQAAATGQTARVAFGAVPLAIGWAAILLGQYLAALAALALLIAGYIITLVMERQAGQHDTLSRRHVWLRWGFTVVAVAMLTTVLVLRLLGQTIVF